MSALTAHKEPEVISATPDEVMDVFATLSGWDSDQHGSTWWTARVDDQMFFDNLDGIDKAILLHLIAKDTSHWTKDLRNRLLGAVEREIAT
jgi:hypothetical protein